MDRISKTWRAILIAALLGAVTLAAFWPVLHNDFIRYDDRDYVTANPHVLGGLNWENLKWAFTTGHASNWHPVTWLSHMLDVQMFGARPGWHHFISLLLHIANTILLFLLLRRLTGADWRSAFVAGFFAVHPLHVESVAWAAERKDVLSGFFFLLTLLAYVAYTERNNGVVAKVEVHSPQTTVHSPDTEHPGCVQGFQGTREGRHSSEKDGGSANSRRGEPAYWLAVTFFALGLMSKPMLVTAPFVLLLLDYWPLKRMGWPDRPFASNWLVLLREKAPFFALALISSVITFVVQGRGHAVTLSLPLTVRAGNAVESYWKYLGKTFWPADLAIFYLHPATRYPASELWPVWLLVGAAVALVVVTAFAAARRERAPWFTVGWLLYLGMLVPVIGLVQVGQQALADRYTYLPLIGIFVCVVWGAMQLNSSWLWARGVLIACGVVALTTSAVLTHQQAKYWRNNLTVFEHALKVNADNAVAHCHVGIELGEQKRYELAEQHFKAALKSDPNCAEAYYGLGYTLENLGKLPEAIEQYQNAIRARSWYEPAHSRLGTVLWSLGKPEQALAEYEAALRQDPDDLEVRYRLGMALSGLGKLAEAVPHLDYVARSNPDFGDALNRLTEALLRQGKLAEAEGRLRDLAERFPRNPAVRINLGSVLWQRGRSEQAIEQYREALRFNSADPVTHLNLGTALSMLGRLPEAGLEFTEAVRLNPDYLPARVSLGEVLAGQGQLVEAATQLEAAVRISPTNANLVLNLGSVLALSGRTNEADARFEEAIRLQPELPEKLTQASRSLAAQGHSQAAIARLTTALYLKPDAQLYFELGGLQLKQGKAKEAVNSYEQALRLKPDWPTALNQLAWVLATDQHAEARNGEEAVRLAARACELDGGKDFQMLATLAAAYAEVGRFDEAVGTAQKAKGLAAAAEQTAIVELLDAGLEQYRKKLAYRQ